MTTEGLLPLAHAALNRMKRAYARGTGCHLTADMIKELGVTVIAEMWDEPGLRSPEE